ncbi:MAG TPA: tRNA pseudouridine(55) synthase TruB [Gemmataceae bacterium]|nr:tRNA pseudouridine(55) synthase TruB [Gemmataceae bacterium]
MNGPDITGLLVLDKPAGMTSRAAVDRVQRWFPRRTRIGHAGTLDPLATGVLVLCLGGSTRLIEYVQRMNKVYRTRFLLGAQSDSDDADGTVTPVSGAVAADAATLAACLAAFVGTIEQVPPAFSAAKVAGQRAYDLARRREEVSLSPRPVQIHAIDILDYTYPHLDLEVRCGKGTYIRSLARDVGARLACGALVQTLRRTRIGSFTAEEALTLDAGAETAYAHLLPAERAVADLPRIVLGDSERKRLGQGQAVAVPSGERRRAGSVSDGCGSVANASGSSSLAARHSPLATPEVAVFDAAGRLAAVALLDPQRQLLQPAKVLQSK